MTSFAVTIELTKACIMPLHTSGRDRTASRCFSLPRQILYNTNMSFNIQEKTVHNQLRNSYA